jgi:hypothetical protein
MKAINCFVKMFLLVLITLNCGVTGVYNPAQIADQNPCSGTAQYTAFCPETSTPAVPKLRIDLNEQISINSKRVPISAIIIF